MSRSAQKARVSPRGPRPHPASEVPRQQEGQALGGCVPLCLCLATLTMALGEGGAGLEALITVALETARSVDAAAVGTESGLGTAFVLV